MNYKQKILESENISKRISITTIESILSETNTKEEAVITIIDCLKEILPTLDIKEYKEINQDLIKLIDYEESKPKKSKK